MKTSISKSVRKHWKDLGILESATKLISDRFGNEHTDILRIQKSRKEHKDVRISRVYISDGLATLKFIRVVVADVKIGKSSSGSVGFTSVEYL